MTPRLNRPLSPAPLPQRLQEHLHERLQPRPGLRTMLGLGLGLGLMMGLLWTGPVHAADPGAAASALQVLTRPLGPQGHEAPAAAPAAPVREQHVVQRSESLDMLIRRHYAGWPFKDEVFRHALHELNPGAVPSAANNLLKRGSTLVLPTAEDLRRTVLQHYPKAGEVVRIRVEVEAEEHARKQGPAEAAGQDKRRWVRFP